MINTANSQRQRVENKTKLCQSPLTGYTYLAYEYMCVRMCMYILHLFQNCTGRTTDRMVQLIEALPVSEHHCFIAVSPLLSDIVSGF